jgi:hypothetical protein
MRSLFAVEGLTRGLSSFGMIYFVSYLSKPNHASLLPVPAVDNHGRWGVHPGIDCDGFYVSWRVFFCGLGRFL